MSKYQKVGDNAHQLLVDEISHKAKEVWNTRQPGENSVRFLQKMPAEYGSHFRFLEVTQKNENTLLVSSGRKQ
ncbi:hypothetical protein CVP05_09810 [Conservatibacter flavescens]|uniref:Hemophilus-specific protein n=2 Tax=Conservatibacter flavescens TaxID=28161 RepID=A0A2M8S107_9PAST|nr:hypothetical protein CVP05_09810 [Conservatibacter flavescens]